MGEGQKGAGVSRLDGLIGLLENGTTPGVRRMASNQIGELVAAHPAQSTAVLRRVRVLLKSMDWDTRVAAGQAVRAIAQHSPTVPVLNPPGDAQRAEWESEEASFLRFDQLSLMKLIEHGVVLLGSSGEEYNADKVDIVTQRKQLKRDLGIDERLTGGDDGLGVRDEDLTVEVSTKLEPDVPKQKADDYVAQLNSSKMSKREYNRLKREAKKRGRSSDAADELVTKRSRDGGDQTPAKDMKSNGETADEQLGVEESTLPWLFSATCRELKDGLLKERWEARHGAAVGLREILKKHAGSAGRVSPGEGGRQENLSWLEDTVCRLLCVLALDRFGDFVGDGVVAPVRETACMAIAAAAQAMDHDRVTCLLSHLQVLLQAKNKSLWEVRHASLLGIKYLLSVVTSEVPTLLKNGFESIMQGLEDEDDDVRAAAAEALTPVTEMAWDLVRDRITDLTSVLWNGLLELDELSISPASLLRLITALYNTAEESISRRELMVVYETYDDLDDEVETMPQKLEMVDLVPRLWPFFRHASSKVRRAAIETFGTLISAKERDEILQWVRPLCGMIMDRVFRNVLLESDKETLELSQQAWNTLNPLLKSTSEDVERVVKESQVFLKHWFSLASCESRATAAEYDKASQLGQNAKPRKLSKKAAKMKALQAKKEAGKEAKQSRIGSEGPPSSAAPAQEDPEDAILMQLSAASGLGVLAEIWPPVRRFCLLKLRSQGVIGTRYLTEKAVSSLFVSLFFFKDNPLFGDLVLDSLKSPFVTPRRVACFVVEQWADSKTSAVREDILERIGNEINGQTDCTFAELSSSVSSLFTDVRALIQTYEEDLQKSVLEELSIVPKSIHTLVDAGLSSIKANDVSKVTQSALALQEPATILATKAFEQWQLESGVKGSKKKKKREALSAVRMHVLATIGYLTERSEMLRTSLVSAAAVALVAYRKVPLPKLVTPHIKALMGSIRTQGSARLQNKAANSLALLAQRLLDRGTPKPVNLVVKNLCKYLRASVPVPTDNEVSSVAKRIEHRGSGLALKALAHSFQDKLFDTLEMLWNLISKPFYLSSTAVDENAKEELMTAMIVCRTIVTALEDTTRQKLVSLLPSVINLCASEDAWIGTESGNCLSELVYEMPSEGMDAVIRLLVPLLDETKSMNVRRNASAALRKIVYRLETKLVPFAAFLVVPMMMRMVDADEVVRDACAGVFGTLVRLMPLEEGAEDDSRMSASMQSEREEAREFLGQLLGSRPRKPAEMPIPIGDDVELRTYQQECLNWLFFLNRYGLHGALCDDMGLGKTLMTLCAIARDNFTLKAQGSPMPSLVVCPSTIVAHWVHEASRFFGATTLKNVLMYLGPPRDRAAIRAVSDFQQADVVVTSYEVLSSDLEHFKDITWNYEVLDEGHVIKNHKTKAARAVRCITAKHKLLLSGTPIQNTVLELWSIFDFLMPGFLGSEKSFKESYGKPIIASRDSKCSDKDRERGMAAMESLHRQVLPFVLRRLKDDVLSELPPKVIQDYYCDMTSLQVRLYEDFSEATLTDGLLNPEDAEDDMDEDEENTKRKAKGGGKHIFQALQYLRRLCSHPAMVVNQKHAKFKEINDELKASGTSLHDVEQSPKLVALGQLLGELGIGDGETLLSKESGGHRVLIFAQMKELLDLVEVDLFQSKMPMVTYLRLDGSVEPMKRQSIVTRFNADPTIDCLLLTTSVGGLGLNLTGADIVIFLEHDWNPTKDLQAMDRAHRIGQKKTVNVYRFIMRSTLEEKIMSIQRFKTHIANAVVNRDNSSLTSMNTTELLNLFKVEGSAGNDGSASKKGDPTDDIIDSKSKGLKAAMEQLGELWDEQQYTDEYNLDEFVMSVKPKS